MFNRLKNVVSFQKTLSEKEEVFQDLESQNEELKALLTQATSRADEKELQIFEMEEKLELLSAQKEENEKGNNLNF